MAWRRDFAPDAVLYLADVDNLARRFVQWRLDRSVDRHVDMVTLDLEGIPDCSLDVVFCLDVLEHLKNPSEVFFAVDRKLKNGGLLFLQAPWGGGFEHLDEAPVDWEKRGGAARLVSGYRLQSRLKPWGDLSGVFLKVGR
jgi:SAM-dependent methyltransferase